MKSLPIFPVNEFFADFICDSGRGSEVVAPPAVQLTRSQIERAGHRGYHVL